jgi:hypothetical protein
VGVFLHNGAVTTTKTDAVPELVIPYSEPVMKPGSVNGSVVTGTPLAVVSAVPFPT